MEEMTLEQAVLKYSIAMKVSLTEARGDAERNILSIMKTEKVPREFAEASWIEEIEELDISELDELEARAKANGASKVVAHKEGVTRKPRERKENEDKRMIIDLLYSAVEKEFPSTITNVERQIDFEYNGVNYSVTLTAHRPPKKKE